MTRVLGARVFETKSMETRVSTEVVKEARVYEGRVFDPTMEIGREGVSEGSVSASSSLVRPSIAGTAGMVAGVSSVGGRSIVMPNVQGLMSCGIGSTSSMRLSHVSTMAGVLEEPGNATMQGMQDLPNPQNEQLQTTFQVDTEGAVNLENMHNPNARFGGKLPNPRRRR
ncbi:hypothetical protein NE237_026396 [Protea cynaroides]|uniref:Uncharacterized protein n=1 Tax=Protea cynaroides TaxID=273540 RepID=A0A9Q0K290_9MAGN|nr:hypothetical protein NE237_026396 [Protea cynaroides]